MSCFSIVSDLKSKKFFVKIRTTFEKINFHNFTDTDFRRIIEGMHKKKLKKLEATLLFVDFTQVFHSIHRWKMEQILLAYGLPKGTVTATTMLYENTKAMVRSPDGNIDFFDIVAGDLLVDTLAPFITYQDYELRTSIDRIKENGFTLRNTRSRRYPTETMKDADYTDDLALLSNTSA